MSDGGRTVIYVVSDSLGETAELVARAAAIQFDGEGIAVRRFSYVDEQGLIDEVLAQVDPARSVVLYTLIVPELRQYLADRARERGIVAVDIMGPAMDAIGRVTRKPPRLEPGLTHRLTEDYYRRIEAIEFAVKSDDGRDPRSVLRADIVLIGVSRTSKTPVSMYLALRRHRVANVPLVPEVDPPQELFQVGPNRVVGLTIRAEVLQAIRLERMRALGLPDGSTYGDMQRIREELAFAHAVFRRLDCPVVDVTNKAVEETANRVLQLVGKGDGR